MREMNNGITELNITSDDAELFGLWVEHILQTSDDRVGKLSGWKSKIYNAAATLQSDPSNEAAKQAYMEAILEWHKEMQERGLEKYIGDLFEVAKKDMSEEQASCADSILRLLSLPNGMKVSRSQIALLANTSADLRAKKILNLITEFPHFKNKNEINVAFLYLSQSNSSETDHQIIKVVKELCQK